MEQQIFTIPIYGNPIDNNDILDALINKIDKKKYKIDCFNLITTDNSLGFRPNTHNLIVICSEHKKETNITLNIQEVVGNEIAKILTDTIKDLNNK